MQGTLQKKELQLTLDHFMHSRPKVVIETQTKIVALALGIEKRLKEHLVFTQHRRDMDRAM